jgi:hypothetical protein
MTNYVKTVDFAAKDALATGNPNKKALGTHVDTEFNNIAIAVATKEDSANKGAVNGYAPLNGSSQLADTYLTSNVPLKNAANIFTLLQAVSNTLPQFQLDETDAITDERYWLLQSSGGLWSLSTAATATPSTAAKNGIAVDRNGTVVTSVVLGNATDLPTVDVKGTLNLNGAALLATTAQTYTGTSSVTTTTPAGLQNTFFACSVDASATTPAFFVKSAGASGWTLSRNATGLYTITHNLGLSSAANLVIVVSAQTATLGVFAHVHSLATNSFSVDICTDAGSPTDEDFNVIAYRIGA